MVSLSSQNWSVFIDVDTAHRLTGPLFQLKDPQNRVIATARAPSSAAGLQELKLGAAKDRLTVLALDISDPAQILKVAEEVEKLLPDGLDYLINNAGISYQPLTTFEDLYVCRGSI